jgi:hypothetical protein
MILKLIFMKVNNNLLTYSDSVLIVFLIRTKLMGIDAEQQACILELLPLFITVAVYANWRKFSENVHISLCLSSGHHKKKLIHKAPQYRPLVVLSRVV